MAKRSAALVAIMAMVVGLQSPLIQASAADPPSPSRSYLAPGESLGEADYVLRFGERGKGTDSLAGTGMQMHGAYGSPATPGLRLFDYFTDGTGTQKNGMYDLAYKTTCCTEKVDKHFPNRLPIPGAYQGDYSFFDGTALWLGHSRFRPGATPPDGSVSPPATGTRPDGTSGPADVGTDVRADNDHLIPIPVRRGAETKRGFLISSHVIATKHAGANYNLRPQPYLDRGGLGLTSPGGIGNRTIDLAANADLFGVLQIRADVVTNGGALADSSDDTGKVTYRYFLDNTEIGAPDTFDLLASSMRTGQGDVRFGPAFGLARGWQGDAAEVFLDNIAVYEIQNMPYKTSWIGKTILPEDSAKYAPDNDPAKQRHVGQSAQALWVDPTPTADGKTLIYTNNVWTESGNATGVYTYEVVRGQGVIRPYARLGPYGRNMGGVAITGDADYVYATFPKYGADNKIDRSCVARYARSAVKQDSAVPTVPFPGLGDPGDLCLPDSTPSGDPQLGDAMPQSIRGLATSAQFLFLSHRKLNEVRVYRKDQSAPVTTITARDPRGMAYGGQGSLWVILGSQVVQEYLVNSAGGLISGRKLTGLTPSAVSVDAQGRLYVANDAAAAQQIQVFDTTNPALPEIQSKRLGDPGGVAAAHGEYGPARFDGIKAVSIDNAGNYYVSSNGVGAAAVPSPNFFDVRRFNGTTKALEGQAQSYISTSQVAPDPAAPGVVYSPLHRYGLNLDAQVPGTEWSPQNTTLMTDRASCPNDARVSGAQGQQSAIAVRYLGAEKKKFLFVTGQGDVSRLGVYKFTDDKHTQTAAMFTENADNAVWPPNEPTNYPVPGRTDDFVWSWRDKNNDCQFDTGEYDAPMYLGGRSNWSVSEQDNLPNHRAGDLWISGWDSPTNRWAIKRVKFTGAFENGSPVYDTKNVEVLKMPQQFAIVHSLVYQSATDTLYVLGRNVDDREYRAGWQLARYDKFYEKTKSGQAPAPTWLNAMPDDVAFCPNDPNKFCQLYTLAAAGDRVYVGNMAGPTNIMNGRIRLYDSANGARVGSLLPGPEVGYQSGWHDMRHAVTAMQLPDGRRFAFSEENFTGRTLLYKGY